MLREKLSNGEMRVKLIRFLRFNVKEHFSDDMKYYICFKEYVFVKGNIEARIVIGLSNVRAVVYLTDVDRWKPYRIIYFKIPDYYTKIAVCRNTKEVIGIS